MHILSTLLSLYRTDRHRKVVRVMCGFSHTMVVGLAGN